MIKWCSTPNHCALMVGTAGLSSLVVVGILCVFGLYEFIRWKECERTCQKRHIANANLLASEVCLGSSMVFGSRAHILCHQSRVENEMSPLECVISVYWRDSAFYTGHRIFMESPIMLLSLVISCSIFSIYQLFSYCGARRAEASMERMLDKMNQVRIPLALPPPKKQAFPQPIKLQKIL